MTVAIGIDPADAARPSGAPVSRRIAAGDGWSIGEFTCRLGPQDRPFEERHDEVTIAAVLEGSFQYRGDGGRALLYPGAFLLGNAGSLFECRHDHAAGDRCISFSFAPWLFEEIAAAAAGSHRFRFPTAMLPASRRLVVPAVEAEVTSRGVDRLALDELALRLPEIVLQVLSGSGEPASAPSPRDQRRISKMLRHIEANADRPLDLAELADLAFMSKYHFLRMFRRTVGLTPYQFLLGLRIRRAGVMLRTTDHPVAAIAFEAGFGDLSTFNGRFRRVYGASPSAFRRRTGTA
jgi:AraC family transcriptional regulator